MSIFFASRSQGIQFVALVFFEFGCQELNFSEFIGTAY